MNQPPPGSADHLEQKQSEPRQRIVGVSSENPNIGPRIEIVLNWQQEELFVAAPAAKLGAIGVLFPTDAAQQFAIGGMESDEVTAAAMVWAEHELLRRQFRESALDVARTKRRAVPTDRDNFVIAKLRDSLDRVLKARRETAASLSVNARAASNRIAGRSEKVEINLRRNWEA